MAILVSSCGGARTASPTPPEEPSEARAELPAEEPETTARLAEGSEPVAGGAQKNCPLHLCTHELVVVIEHPNVAAALLEVCIGGACRSVALDLAKPLAPPWAEGKDWISLVAEANGRCPDWFEERCADTRLGALTASGAKRSLVVLVTLGQSELPGAVSVRLKEAGDQEIAEKTFDVAELEEQGEMHCHSPNGERCGPTCCQVAVAL